MQSVSQNEKLSAACMIWVMKWYYSDRINASNRMSSVFKFIQRKHQECKSQLLNSVGD